MWQETNWQDYELLDASDGARLERWGSYTLVRPDPQVIWKGVRVHPAWRTADATYQRSKNGGGGWKQNHLPAEWNIKFPLAIRPLTLLVKPMGFKHTGVFPEQAVNWSWFSRLIANAGRPIKVLNLFAYTGGATIAAAAAGAQVCHVDAAKGMVLQAKRNAELSGLADAPIRYIVDDCKKFIEREIRRGNRYDAIIMDPPSYGRGPNGEVWKLEDQISDFLALAVQVLSDKPLFVLLNSYTTGLSAATMGYLLNLAMRTRFGGVVRAEEIGLPVTATGGTLPCGASARWTSREAEQ